MDLIKQILMESFYNEKGRLPNAEELEMLYSEFCKDVELNSKDEAAS